VPGIASIALAGHTPGHTGYRIASGDAAVVDIGDIAHSSIISLADPAWTIEFDTDAVAGRTQREATLARLAVAHTLVFAPHFPYPGVGRIEKAGQGYRWMPAAR
jgi:glyoxylase-like metal-dependent hydrolase (beta-lactamase superfamily II)